MEVLKIRTGRGQRHSAPDGIFIDPYRGRILPLKPPPRLTGTEGEDLKRKLFARFPGLARMHQRDAQTPCEIS